MYAEKSTSEMIDLQEHLINAARKGDRSAASELVSKWFKRIYNFTLNYFNDHDVAMELAQQTFIAMYRKIDKLQDSGSFKPWLYRIASNYCHEEFRKRNRRQFLTIWKKKNDGEHYSYDIQAEGRQFNPSESFHHEELSEKLRDCLGKINAEQREVLIMKEYEGLKFKEIALALGVSENTVKSRMYYGLSAMRKVMEKEKLTLDSFGYGV